MGDRVVSLSLGGREIGKDLRGIGNVGGIQVNGLERVEQVQARVGVKNELQQDLVEWVRVLGEKKGRELEIAVKKKTY